MGRGGRGGRGGREGDDEREEGGREGDGGSMTGGREGGRAQCCRRKLLRRLSDNVAVVSDGEIFHHRAR